MGIFQGVNPQGLEGARSQLLQRLQAQMGARQQNVARMGMLNRRNQRPPGYPQVNAGVGGHPIGLGMARGSTGRVGVTQSGNMAAAIMARMGAINPRALEGEASASPGMGVPQPHFDPGHAGVEDPSGGARAPSPGFGPSGFDPSMLAGMGGADMPMPGALPAAPTTASTGFGPAASGASSWIPTGGAPADMPAGALGRDVSMSQSPTDIEGAQGLVNLGGGRFYDPATGSIRGFGNMSAGGGARFIR